MRSIATLQLVGGCPVFDFTNTISNRNDPDYFDYLATYDDFMQWTDKIGLLPKGITRLKDITTVKNNPSIQHNL